MNIRNSDLREFYRWMAGLEKSVACVGAIEKLFISLRRFVTLLGILSSTIQFEVG